MRNVYVGASLAGAVSLMALVAQPVRAELPVPSVNDLQSQSTYFQDGAYAQVNSVSELTDVDPNSWAFQALKTVVERYGCLEGYPSKKYLGTKPLSRYEFAAGLNACLEKINDQINAATSNLATKDDLAALARLQEEFKNELAALRGRVDALEAKTKEIESKLFSTTAKLDGEVIFSVFGQGADSNANIRDGAGNFQGSGGGSNVSFLSRVRLNIRASSLVTKGDQLRIRLNGFAGQSVYFDSLQGRQGQNDYINDANARPGATNGSALVDFDKVYYDTPIGLFGSNNIRLRVGPAIQNLDLIGANKYTANGAQNFSLRNFSRDPLFIQIQDNQHPGAAISVKFSPALNLTLFYSALDGGSAGTVNAAVGSGTAPFGGSGLFGGSTQLAAEIAFKPTPAIDLKLGYSYTSLSSAGSSGGFIFGNAALSGGGDAGLLYNSNNVSNISHSIFSAGLDYDVVPGIAIFGRYTFDTASFYGYSPAGNRGGTSVGGSLDANTWKAGLAFPDLLGKGNLLEFAYLQPINIVNNGVISFVNNASGAAITNPASDPRGYTRVFTQVGNNSTTGLPPARNATESQIGAAFRFRVSDRLTITPEVYFVISPNNVDQQGITIGNLRATFEF
ncbi:MAG: iron uptake porin [Anaerolineae bacterium]|nr:iron uptake porin [Gloeobacterales cyanobacterium ES-bin-313]